MNEAQKSEWVQRYLEGELAGQELLDFEQHLEEDLELQTLLEEFKILVGGIRYHGRKQAWDEISALEADAEANETLGHFSIGERTRTLYWAVAATVAILAVCVAYFINNNQSVNTDQLFADNFMPYAALTYAPQRSDTLLTSMKEQAFAAYSNRNYPEAISLFEDILAQSEETIVWFYLGNAYLTQEQTEQAIAAFQQFLEADPESILYPQATWFLALAYLKNDQLEPAKQLLNKLAEMDSSYSERAKKLLNSL